MSDGRDRELAESAAELAETLDELRAELERERRASLGIVDLLRFTERYTIPAVIAVLEANVRMLELLAGSIRVATGDSESGASSETASHAASATLDALDRALREASQALAGGEPTDRRARELLRDARELRDEVAGRLGEDPGTRSETAPAVRDDDVASAGDVEGPVSVEVESELDTIREEVDEERRAGERLEERLAGDDSLDETGEGSAEVSDADTGEPGGPTDNDIADE